MRARQWNREYRELIARISLMRKQADAAEAKGDHTLARRCRNSALAGVREAQRMIANMPPGANPGKVPK